MYVEGPPPLYISYASPEQTRQDQYQETLEAAGDKGQRIKKVTKMNESKQCTNPVRPTNITSQGR